MGKHQQDRWATFQRDFFDMIDLGGNMQRALRSVDSFSGVVALVMGVALLLMAFILFWGVWFLDYSSTMEASRVAVETISSALPSHLIAQGSLVFTVLPLVAALFPSLMELVGSRFGLEIKLAGCLVYTCVLFDLITDAPHTHLLMQAYEPFFAEMAWGLGLLLYWPLHVPVLILASTGLEMIFVVFAVVSVHLLAKGASGLVMK
jgi:hypothetical protein